MGIVEGDEWMGWQGLVQVLCFLNEEKQGYRLRVNVGDKVIREF